MLKKWFIAACCSVVVCLAITLWVVPEIKSSRAAAAVQPASSVGAFSAVTVSQLPSSSSAPPESEKPMYLVGEFEGSVAFFRFGEKEPQQVLETPLSMLPEQDRRLLREGIPVMTEEELASVLEDYS